MARKQGVIEGLFGPVSPPRKTTKPSGYAGRPGKGPEGQSCKTCKHHVVVRYAKRYHKCWLVRDNWTHGPATDILVRSPACDFWEKIR